MAFITKSNLSSFIYGLDVNPLNLSGHIYKDISIYFFSKYELASLLAVRELLKDPQNFVNVYYHPVQIADRHEFIYEGKSPAYHTTITCPRLNANYENFKIPKEIREKGVDEVIKFRTWFEVNKHLLKKTNGAFEAKLKLKWPAINTNMIAITRDNGGAVEYENYSLEKFEEKIENLIEEAGKYYWASPKNTIILNRLNKMCHLAYIQAPIEKNNTGYSDQEVKSLLKDYNETIKKPLKKFLIEYYRLKLNPELKFEGRLLEQMGFKPCGECGGIAEIIESSSVPRDSEMPF